MLDIFCFFLGYADAVIGYFNLDIFHAINQVKTDPEKVNRLTQDFTNVINEADAVCIDITNYDTVPTLLTKIRDVATALVNGQLTPQQAGEEMDAEIELFSE